MTKILMVILYIIIGILLLGIIYKEYKKSKNLNCKLFFLISYGIYYVMIPVVALGLSNYKHINISGFMQVIADQSIERHFFVLLYVLLGLITYLITYKILNNITPSRKMSIEIDNKKIYKMCLIIGVVTFIIGAISSLIILSEMGGVSATLKKVEIMRAYGTDRSTYMKSSLLFTHMLINISLVSPFMLQICLRLKKRRAIVVLFYISQTFAIFCLLFNGGRMGMLLYVISFIVPVLYKKMKYPIIGLIFVGIVALGMLSGLDNLIFYMSYGYVKATGEVNLSVLNEFAFPFRTLLDVKDINNIMGYRYGIDYFTWIINIIPSSILGIVGLTKIPVGHTYITQYYDPTGITMGGVPTDILTLGLRQYGVMGIIINMIFIAIFCVALDKISTCLKNKEFDEIILRTSIIAFIIVGYSDLDSFVRNRYDMLILIGVVIAIYIISSHKIKKVRRF